MHPEELEKLKFPVGHYQEPAVIDRAQLEDWMMQIQLLPAKLHQLVSNMTEEELDRPYRPGGWTGRQVIHHIPDSHMNAYIRFKLALTEDHPDVRPYFEDRWAELADGKFAPPQVSLNLLDSIHQRWILLLRSLTDADLDRTYFHPASHKVFKLRSVIGMYAWHGEHHFAHVKSLRP
jgi:hypothetical protein